MIRLATLLVVLATALTFTATASASATNPIVGDVLTTTNGGWQNNPTSFTYQWQRCNPTCANVSSATASSYTIVVGDIGYTLQVIVTAHNAYGQRSQTSGQTGTVAASGGITQRAGFPVSVTGLGQATVNVTPVSAGDLLVIAGYLNSTARTVTGVTGGGVTNWSRVTDIGVSSRYTYIWEGVVTTPGASSITVAFSGSIATINSDLYADSYTNSRGTNWVSLATSTNSGAAGGSPLPLPALTAPADGLYFAYLGGNGAFTGTSSGFTLTATAASNAVITNLAGTSGTAYAPTFTNTGTTGYVSAAGYFGLGTTAGATWSCNWGAWTSNPINLPDTCWRPYGDTSFTNTQLPASPTLASNSSTMVTNLFNGTSSEGDGTIRPLHPIPAAGSNFNNAMYFAKSSDPVYTITCTRSCAIPGGVTSGVTTVHIPCGAQPTDGSDHNMLIYDQPANREVNIFDVQSTLPNSGCTGGSITVGDAQTLPINGDGISFDPPSGMLRERELAAGLIPHNLRLVDKTCNGTSVYPIPSGSDICGGSVSTAPPNGSYIWLDLTDSQVDALGVVDWQKTILKALHNYGGIFLDNGSNGAWEWQVADSPPSYYGGTNPWIAWANAEVTKYGSASAANISWTGSGTLDLNWNNLTSAWWASHIHIVNPCVIQQTC